MTAQNIYQFFHQEEGRKAQAKNDESFKNVKHALDRFRSKPTGYNPCQRDPEGVHPDGDGNGGQEKRAAFPPCAVHAKPDQKTETGQGEEIAQPVAGRCHIEFMEAEINEIAFLIDGNAKELDDADPEMGRKELHVGGEQGSQGHGQGH